MNRLETMAQRLMLDLRRMETRWLVERQLLPADQLRMMAKVLQLMAILTLQRLLPTQPSQPSRPKPKAILRRKPKPRTR
jgi:hypothetical protein